MPVDVTHADYDARALEWARARDVLAGEDAVKAAGERYLPRMDSQSEEEYSAYKARASFFGATARTLEEYLDLVFRRAPACALCATAGEPSEGVKGFAADCDLWGLDFERYARRVVGEVLAVGRAGSLVLWEEASASGLGATGAGRPVVSLWRTEDVINWRVERSGQERALVEVVLRDADRLRVLRLADVGCEASSVERGESGPLGERALPGGAGAKSGPLWPAGGRTLTGSACVGAAFFSQ